MPEDIVLYDLPSQAPNRSWSGNVWKTRLVLNFKKISYTTHWVPYTELQDTLKGFGIKGNPPGSWSEYSVPTIGLPDGSYIMDSAAIARHLESLQPQPSLHLSPELENEAQNAMGETFMALALYLAPAVVDGIVASEDLVWFKEDRAKRFGMTVEELMTPKDGSAAFAAAQSGLDKCRRVLTEHQKDRGPFILGSVPCYADFYLVSSMQMFRQCSREIFEQFLEEAGQEMRDLYHACEGWTLKQN